MSTERETSMAISVELRCTGCAAVVDPLDPVAAAPFRCPNVRRAPDVDHVLAWDPVAAGVRQWPDDPSPNPFVRYRTLQHAYWLARARGLTDADHVAMVGRLDRAVAGVDGKGFVITPVEPADAAGEALGAEVWAKDEAGNVAGSHKARHLMGLLLHLDVQRVSTRTRLAIASCGNAALAAATLARATRRPLDVFVPPWADPAVVTRLEALGASLTRCPRTPLDPPGDPCVHRFHEAVARGALPFCCQGSENGLTIDGGTTLGHELASQLSVAAWAPDRLFVQVGGGALGVSVARGLDDAVRLGVLHALPALHPVQSEGSAPLARAWRRVARRALWSVGRGDLADRLSADGAKDLAGTGVVRDAAAALAAGDAAEAVDEAVDEALRHAATHRSQYMWPWEDEPMSLATGILDDETYDWLALVRATLRTGGWPVVAAERHLDRANQLAPAHIDPTGSAGLGGALAVHAADPSILPGSKLLVLFTGARR